MKKRPELLADVMTDNPAIIGPSMDLKRALELMKGWKVRHLPVVKDNQIVGILSERDVYRTLAEDVSPKPSVGDAMTTPAYQVNGVSMISDVAEFMAEERIGSAIVTDNDRDVIGIFTTTDALKILAKIMREPDERKFKAMRMNEYFQVDNTVSY